MIDTLKRLLASLTPDELKIIRGEIEESLDEGVHDISEKGIKFIAVKEGYYKYPYNDVAGYATIAFGHLLHHGPCTAEDLIKWKDGVTIEEALNLLKKKLRKYITTVNKGLKVSQNQNQFDALVALCYNIGQNGFKYSSCLKRINAGKSLDKIEARWKVWKKAKDPKTGKLVPYQGLINRRKWEWDVYAYNKYGNLDKFQIVTKRTIV